MQNDTVGMTGKTYGGATPVGNAGAGTITPPFFGFRPVGNLNASALETLNTEFNTFIGKIQKLVPAGNSVLFLEACEDLKAAYWTMYGGITASVVGNV